MTRAPRVPPSRLRDPVILLALGFGSGLAPRAPGTAGTLVGVLAWAALLPLAGPAYLIATAAVVAIGIPICGIAARRLGVHDHPAIVWDEIAGFLVTMIAAPAGVLWVVYGFLAFRLFDVWKPWPIGWLDRRVSGGAGIMVDDVLAGLYALALLQASAWFAGAI